MARTDLTVQEPDDTGLVPSFSAANALGHSIPPNVLLVVKNGGGAPINVTLVTPGTVRDLAIADRVVAVAAGAEKWFGQLGASYTDTADNKVDVDFSAVTSVTVGAFAI